MGNPWMASLIEKKIFISKPGKINGWTYLGHNIYVSKYVYKYIHTHIGTPVFIVRSALPKAGISLSLSNPPLPAAYQSISRPISRPISLNPNPWTLNPEH